MSNEEIDNVFVPLCLLFVFPFGLTPPGCCRLHFTFFYLFLSSSIPLSFSFCPWCFVLIIARLHIIIFALCLSGGVRARTIRIRLIFCPHIGSIVCTCVRTEKRENNKSSRNGAKKNTIIYLLDVGGSMTSFETNNSNKFRRTLDPMIII